MYQMSKKIEWTLFCCVTTLTSGAEMRFWTETSREDELPGSVCFGLILLLESLIARLCIQRTTVMNDEAPFTRLSELSFMLMVVHFGSDFPTSTGQAGTKFGAVIHGSQMMYPKGDLLTFLLLLWTDI